VRCMYHGMLFNSAGTTIEIPGQDAIPKKACVKSYPVIEDSGWIWVWMGDPDKADEALKPPVYGLQNPDWITYEEKIEYDCNYWLINNNLTDLGHLAWVHRDSFGSDETWRDTIPEVSLIDRGVRMDRWLRDIPPIPPLGKAADHEKVDHWARLDYFAPGVFHFYNALFPSGTADRYESKEPDLDDSSMLFEHYTQQAVTPISARKTFYVYSWGPSRRYGTEEDSAIMREVNKTAFLEDKDIIEAQQQSLDLEPGWKPMATVHDKAVVMFERLMERLMAEERE